VKKKFSRYSVISGNGVDSNVNALSRQVSAVGGVDIVCAAMSRQVFTSLTDNMVTKLRRSELYVTRVQRVLTAVVNVPREIVGTAEYTPGDMLDLLGLNSFKFSIDPPLLGEGYNVAVIDTGIRISHQLLEGKVVYSKNFTSGPDGDGFNHGTGVASIIHAVVPYAGILDMKALDSTGNGTEENVVLALEECISLQDSRPDISPNIINMSIGSPDDNNPNNPMRVACRAAMDIGIVIVAAAGNNGAVEGAITSPACEEYVTAVGSLSISPLVVNEFSSRGPTRAGLVKPDVIFLGENIILASSVDDTATTSKSGTSFSAPLTTGVIVLTMEGVVATQTIPPELFVGKNVITSMIVIDDMLPVVCTKPEGVPAGKDNDYGYGVPVGSLIYNRSVAIGLIDMDATINLLIIMMMIQMMARLSMGV